MRRNYFKVIITLILISGLTLNIGYALSDENIENKSLFKMLNPLGPSVELIDNVLERHKVADLIDEGHGNIKDLIIYGNLNSDPDNRYRVFSTITKDELVQVLDKYAIQKGLQIKEVNTDFEGMPIISSNAANRLITAGIINKDYIEAPYSLDLIEASVTKINKLSKKKQIIEKEISLILENSNEKLRGKEQINFNLIHGETGANISYNGDVTNHPASIIKTFYLYVFLKEVESGKRSLVDERVFVNKDKYNGNGSRITGSGVLQGSKTNVTYTWGDLLRLMIVKSDNVATSMVMRELGSANIDAWAKKVNLTDTQITGPIYTAVGVATRSSANDLTKVLYLLDTLPIEFKKFAMKQLSDCEAKDRIARQMKDTKWLGNKSGTLSDYVGDSALIRYEGNNTLYMTMVMRTTDDSYINISKSEEKISELSHEIVNKLKAISVVK